VKRRTRRDTETFSMSFLDCICCGFGAIILLLVLNEFGEPLQLEQAKVDLDAQIVKMQREIFDIRGVAIVLERELRARIEQLTEEQKRLARLRGDLSSVEGKHKASTDEEDALKKLTETMTNARRALIDETRELRASGRKEVYNQPVAGVPIDSEYVIFIVDTSGSMQSQNWRYAEEKLGEVLNIYPKLKGIQVMDDEGGYMFSEYRGKWIPDSPARRKAILERFRKWQAFSNSSPSEGIIAAVRTFWTREHPISVYVFGDEFTGPSIQEVVDTVTASTARRVRASGSCASIRSGSRSRISIPSTRACVTRRSCAYCRRGMAACSSGCRKATAPRCDGAIDETSEQSAGGRRLLLRAAFGLHGDTPHDAGAAAAAPDRQGSGARRHPLFEGIP
jgi:hypothetical protein